MNKDPSVQRQGNIETVCWCSLDLPVRIVHPLNFPRSLTFGEAAPPAPCSGSRESVVPAERNLST